MNRIRTAPRIILSLLLLAGLAAAALLAASPVLAGEGDGIPAVHESRPVTVYAPAPGQQISLSRVREFAVTFSRFQDSPALWYQVRLYMPANPDGSERFIEYRYNPDDDRDMVRRNPTLRTQTGLFEAGMTVRVVVTPMGASEKLLAEYPGTFKPTGLAMEYYAPLAPPSKPVTFIILP
mgnify:CR=1 FL=1